MVAENPDAAWLLAVIAVCAVLMTLLLAGQLVQSHRIRRERRSWR